MAVKSKRMLYGVHPAVEMVQKWVAQLPEKTGRSLEEWLEHIRAFGPATEAEQRDWLKAEHGMGTNAAWWLAERVHGKGTEDSDPDIYLEAAARYVEDMFAGGKSGLRPIYDRLLDLGLSIAGDVKACPCKTIVPLYREHVFAQLKPSTRTRIDLGLALAKYSKKIPAAIIDTGGAAKKDRITHRMPITSLDEITPDVEKWLRIAYELDMK